MGSGEGARACERCGQALKKKQRRFCSSRCSIKTNGRPRPKADDPPKKCVTCGDEFTRREPRRESRAGYLKRQTCGKPECRRVYAAQQRASRDPHVPGRRTVVARTCLECGELRPGSVFVWTGTGTQRVCMRCLSRRRRESSEYTERDRRASREYMQRMQEDTRKAARRHRYEWTGPELELVATRDDLSTADLAKMLGRTYQAVIHARALVRSDPREARLAGLRSPIADKAAP